MQGRKWFILQGEIKNDIVKRYDKDKRTAASLLLLV